MAFQTNARTAAFVDDGADLFPEHVVFLQGRIDRRTDVLRSEKTGDKLRKVCPVAGIDRHVLPSIRRLPLRTL